VAAAEPARAVGADLVLGGVTWERMPVDPLPGPRRLDEVTGAEPIAAAAALAGPETAGPGGFRFAESRLAAALGAPTVLIDPNPGPEAVAEGIRAAAKRLGCDRVLLVDVGGDALARGDEPGLGSPLCDAVMLAAAGPLARAGVRPLGAIFGAGCDGELTVPEVLDRLADVAAAGGLLGVTAPGPAGLQELERAVAAVPTEASAQALSCARGETGSASIRDGRRTVELSALGGLAWHFDAAVAAEVSPLARAVSGAASLQDANERVHELGVRTELDGELHPGGVETRQKL
jgi:hypothetical protein